MSEAVATPTQTPGAPAPVDPALTPPDTTASAPEANVKAEPLNVDTPEPEPELTPDEAVVVTYDPTGDSGLDVALAYVGSLGFGPDHPGIVAAHTGDFKPLEAALKAMGDKAKGYAPYLAAAKDAHDRNTARNQVVLDAVVAEVGGSSNWNTIRAWAAANAEPAEKKEINAAFAAGKTSAVLMASRLAAAYAQSGESNLTPASGLKAGAGKGDSNSNAPLSPAEFKAEIAKLGAKYGTRTGDTPEFKQLVARRSAYKGN